MQYPRHPVPRPDGPVGIEVGDIFDDRQTVPDEQRTIAQDRHFARRRVGQNAGLCVRLPQLDAYLFERDAKPLEHQPGPEAPARPGFVADDEGELGFGHAFAFLERIC